MLFHDFVHQVRDALSIMGLPLNFQPPDHDLKVFHAAKISVEKTVERYSNLIVKYENFVNVE